MIDILGLVTSTCVAHPVPISTTATSVPFLNKVQCALIERSITRVPRRSWLQKTCTEPAARRPHQANHITAEAAVVVYCAKVSFRVMIKRWRSIPRRSLLDAARHARNWQPRLWFLLPLAAEPGSVALGIFERVFAPALRWLCAPRTTSIRSARFTNINRT